MINVTFVCLGNICRSPMAELIFKKMVEERGLKSGFCITSCGTDSCEEGNSVYAPAKRTLEKHGVQGTHIARQMTLSDVINNDYILVMDSKNLFDVLRLTGGSHGEKIFKLMSFTERPGDVADPWYTRDFNRTYREIDVACQAFLNFLLDKHSQAFDYDKRH